VVVHDPHAGEVRGHRRLRQFVQRNQVWFAHRQARIEKLASTCVNGRAVVELLAHLTEEGHETTWPVAVVAESPDDRSVEFRTYCSQLPVDHRRHIRPPILPPADVRPKDVVGRYLAALQAGNTDAILGTFTTDGYVREPVEARTHRGAELRAYFDRCFSAGGGVGLQQCAITDDGARCALEYNCVNWGPHPVAPQAGLGVYERPPTACWPRPGSTTTSTYPCAEAADTIRSARHECHFEFPASVGAVSPPSATPADELVISLSAKGLTTGQRRCPRSAPRPDTAPGRQDHIRAILLAGVLTAVPPRRTGVDIFCLPEA